MVSTFYTPRKLSSTEVNPMSNLLSGALDTYQKGLGASYMPRQMEADIFNKQIGPLSTLATTPMFLNNPQFQQVLSALISRQFPGMMGGVGTGQTEENGGAGVEPLTYAGQANKDLEEAKTLADELTNAGQAKIAISGGAAHARRILGPLGDLIVHGLSNGEVTPDLAKKQNQFETKLSIMKNNAVQTGRISAAEANEKYKQLPNETPSDTIARLTGVTPNLYQQNFQRNTTPNNYKETTPVKSAEQKITNDEQQKKDDEAAALHFNTTPGMVLAFRSTGQKLTPANMRKFLEGEK